MRVLLFWGRCFCSPGCARCGFPFSHFYGSRWMGLWGEGGVLVVYPCHCFASCYWLASCKSWLLASSVVAGLLSLCSFHFLRGRAVFHNSVCFFTKKWLHCKRGVTWQSAVSQCSIRNISRLFLLSPLKSIPQTL